MEISLASRHEAMERRTRPREDLRLQSLRRSLAQSLRLVRDAHPLAAEHAAARKLAVGKRLRLRVAQLARRSAKEDFARRMRRLRSFGAARRQKIRKRFLNRLKADIKRRSLVAARLSK